MASVIKAGKIIPSGTAVQHTEFNFEDMSAQASLYLESVRQKATQIVAQAQQQAKQTIVQAAERGRQSAREAAEKAALEEMKKKWQALAPILQQAIDGAAQLRSSWLRQWEQQVIQLAIAVAERLVRGELSRHPEIPHQWIREALELASSGQSITLRLHPADYETLGQLKDVIAGEFSNLSATNIVPDPRIAPGGCRVDTEFGHIDQQLATQLKRIEEELTG
jgi:flagellar biosynthesis/type III secretory pathway protein FliH